MAPSSVSESFSKANSHYERRHSLTNLTKSNLLIDLKAGYLIFEHIADNRSDVSYENFAFQEVLDVSASDYQIAEGDLQGAMVPSDFRQHCFTIKFRSKGVKLIACASEADRH